MTKRKARTPKAYQAGGGTRIVWADNIAHFPAGYVERIDGFRPGTIRRLKGLGLLDGVPGVHIAEAGGVFLSLTGQSAVLSLVREHLPDAERTDQRECNSRIGEIGIRLAGSKKSFRSASRRDLYLIHERKEAGSRSP